jgi:hypothetical protein
LEGALSDHESRDEVIYQLAKCLQEFTTQNSAVALLVKLLPTDIPGVKEQF